MRMLIDGDILAYKSAFAVQKTIRTLFKDGEKVAEFDSAKARNEWLEDQGLEKKDVEEKTHLEYEDENELYKLIDIMIKEWVNWFLPDSATIYLSGDTNFRKDLSDTYKANRSQPKPFYFKQAIEYIKDHYNAKVTDGIEADDAIAIDASSTDEEIVVISEDKDFQQVPDIILFRPSSQIKVQTERVGATRFLYMQAIMGDRADNIEGIRGLGEVAARNALGGLKDEGKMYNKVLSLYKKHGLTEDDLFINMNLLYLLREENKFWQKPT